MRHCIAASATALVLPLGALAQDPDDAQVVEVDMYKELNGPFDPAEYPNNFSIGGGALGPMSGRFSPHAPNAVSWNLRYGWHPVNLLTWELAYTGATDEMTVARTEDATLATLLETGLKADIFGRRAPITPIVAAGVGYGAFTAGQRDLATLTVPLAAGLEGRAKHLLLGTRVTWRPTFFDKVAFSELGADSWMWTADIGTRF